MDKKYEDQIGTIFDTAMKAFEVCVTLEVDTEQGNIEEGAKPFNQKSTEKILRGLLTLQVEEAPGFDDYCMHNIPLAQESDTITWLYNSLSLYRDPIKEAYLAGQFDDGAEPEIEHRLDLDEPESALFVVGDKNRFFSSVFGADSLVEHFPELLTTGVYILDNGKTDRCYITEDRKTPAGDTCFFSLEEMKCLKRVEEN